jgi:hypothetical protein
MAFDRDDEAEDGHDDCGDDGQPLRAKRLVRLTT